MRALTSSYLSSMARLLRIDSSVMLFPNLFEHFDAPSERHSLGELLVVKGLGLPWGTLQFPLQPLLAQLVEAVPGGLPGVERRGFHQDPGQLVADVVRQESVEKAFCDQRSQSRELFHRPQDRRRPQALQIF